MNWKTKKVKLSELKPYPANPRTLNTGILVNGKRSHFNYSKLCKNKVANTILKSVSYSGLGIYHYEENRELSIEELKRLCSFPDNYILTGTPKEQVARLGNAVMPNMMYQIAKTLKENIL